MTSGTTRTLSWLADLNAYVAKHGQVSLEDGDRRGKLLQKLQENPTSADAWLAFLAHEEEIAKATQNIRVCDNSGVSLYHLFYWATQVVPRAKNQSREEYIKLWLGYARHQWYALFFHCCCLSVSGTKAQQHTLLLAATCRVRSQDDARDTFKTLKSQNIGDTSALLYTEWAALEVAAGHTSKAVGVLQKGLKSNAQPKECAAAATCSSMLFD